MNYLTVEDIAVLAVAQVDAEDRMEAQQAQAQAQEQAPPPAPPQAQPELPQEAQQTAQQAAQPTTQQPAQQASQQAARQAARHLELSAAELAAEAWASLQLLYDPPFVPPSHEVVLRQAEFFLLGGYHLRHVMAHAVEQVVMHFVLKAPAVMEEAAAVSEQGCSGAGRSSDAGPSQIQEHSAGEGRLHRARRRKITRKG